MKMIQFRFLPLALLMTIEMLFASDTYAQKAIDGKKLFDQEQYSKAKVMLKDILSKSASDDMAWYYLGDLYFKEGNLDSADICYHSGSTANLENPYNFIGLGKILLQKNSHELALEDFTKAEKMKKKDIDLLLEIVKACISGKTKDTATASAYLAKCKKINSSNSNIYIAFGDFIAISGNYGDAANYYERAIFYNSKNYAAYIRLGDLYSSARNFRLADSSYTTALKLDSTLYFVYRKLGTLEYTFAKYSDASMSFYKLLKNCEYTVDDKEKYAFSLFFSKKFDLAGQQLNELLKIEPNNPVIYRLKAYISYETNEFAEGLKLMNTFFSYQDPAKVLPSDHEYYGKLLIKNDMDSIGILELKKTIVLDSSRFDLYEDIAKSYSKLKNHYAAAESYKALARYNPSDLATLYFQMGREYYFAFNDANKSDTTNVKKILFQADSAYAKVAELVQDSYIGNFWRGRIQAQLDPDAVKGLAFPYYTAAAAILEKDESKKLSKNLLECYRYIGYYYYVKFENSSKANHEEAQNFKIESLSFWNKVLAIDPNDQTAKKAIEGINKNKR
jgi:Flp pilus assembly protein TadD